MTKAIPAATTVFKISKVGSTTTDVIPSAIAAAKPAVLTVPTGSISEGDVITLSGTDFSELDGKTFVAGVVTTGTDDSVPLVGSDTTGSLVTLGTTPVAGVMGLASSFETFCLSTFSREGGSADTVAVGTFCDPSATIVGTSDAGTISFAGYMDPTEAGYIEFMKASDDKKPRTMLVMLPDSLGTIILNGTVNSFSESFDLGNAISWTSGMGLSTNPTYLWN